MDLLNTILNSMQAPPSNEHQKKQIKHQKELQERMKKKQKEELLRFRKYVEDRIERFAKDNRPYIEFQPLDKVHRSVVHEIAEFSGFIALSFGIEDVDRYTVVYKKENTPSEDEMLARRNGDGWNEEIAKEYAEMRIQQREEENEKRRAARLSANSQTSAEIEIKPVSNYKDKYAHLIGQETAMEARKTETNASYGFVPSKNKKDIRSIEQTLADIQAKKKLKLQQQQEETEREQQEQQTQQLISNNQTEENQNTSSDLAPN